MISSGHFFRVMHWFPQCLSRGLLVTILGTLGACASLPEDYTRTESSAIEDYYSTSIGSRWKTLEEENPGKSGFLLMPSGRDAFNIRVSMTDLAEKSIDVQVYIWERDKTGRIFADRLIRAADRGVRVRLLVDDMGLGASDDVVAAMNAHPNIEIRLFNPFANRGNKMLDFVVDLGRVNHRMHNKLVIADNSLALVGGRNVGDHYFGVKDETNFRDLDIAALGPIVRDISGVFDHFWESNWSVPMEVLVDRPYTMDDLQTARTRLLSNLSQDNYPYSIEQEMLVLQERVETLRSRVIWAPGIIVWDDPETLEETGQTSEMIAAFRNRMSKIENSFTIESAYFVIGERGLINLNNLIDRGVEVRILTNSLVSNDVLAAHAGHANYRRQIVRAGGKLYEFRADSAGVREDWDDVSRAALHTKALVFDDKAIFVGSFNLDPRSSNINTEAGIYVESEEMAAQLKAFMDEGVQPKNAYRLTLDPAGNLEWVTLEDGVELRYDRDPLSTFGQRFMSGLYGILPLESQL